METRQAPSESTLMARVVARDERALEAVYDRYARVVHAICLKILGSHHDAEEATLDTFATLWRAAGQYDVQRGRLDAWVFQIARSRALDKARQRQRADRLAEALAAEPAVEIQGPEAGVWISEQQREVGRALAGLPDAQRKAIELAYYEGLTQQQIADRIGEPLGTVKTRIRSGVLKLRDSLSSWWGN